MFKSETYADLQDQAAAFREHAATLPPHTPAKKTLLRMATLREKECARRDEWIGRAKPSKKYPYTLVKTPNKTDAIAVFDAFSAGALDKAPRKRGKMYHVRFERFDVSDICDWCAKNCAETYTREIMDGRHA